MRHSRLQEELSPYLDGVLDARRAARLEEHLAACPECRAQLAELRRTVELLRGLPEADPPAHLGSRVMASVHEAEQDRRSWLGGLGWPVAAVTATLLLVLLVQGVEVSIQLPWAQAPQVALAAPPATSGRVAAFRARSESTSEDRSALAARADATPPAANAPSFDACLASPDREACRYWYPWLENLAVREPEAFLSEMESLPPGLSRRWMGEFTKYVRDAGMAAVVASRLRASGDPRASRLAPRFERASAGR